MTSSPGSPGIVIDAFDDPVLDPGRLVPAHNEEWSSSIDGGVYRRVPNPPQYPMQLEVGVFDVPNWSSGEDDAHVPTLEIDWIKYTP